MKMPFGLLEKHFMLHFYFFFPIVCFVDYKANICRIMHPN